MNAAHFDRLTRTLRGVSSRRGLLRGLAAASVLAAIRDPDATRAKNSKTKKKPKRNQYSCVSVGGSCRGKDKNCCSGRCQGKKPKNGENDKSRCVAHDTGTIENGERGCLVGDDSYGPGGTLCTTAAGEELGLCWRTTGNAGFCGYGTACIPGSCQKDSDCIAACGAGAACIVIPDACEGTDTLCFGIGACDG